MQLNEQQLADAARRLRIPVPKQEILEQILKLEGTMLIRAVEEALKGQTRSQLYLQGVLLACHESTQDRLRRARVNTPPIATLVAIGKAEGPDFGLRIREWEQATFADGDTARYVRLTIARVLQQTKNQEPAAPIPHGSSTPTAVTMPSGMSYRPHRDNQAAAPPPSAPAAATQHAPDQLQGRRQHQFDEPQMNRDMPPEPPEEDFPHTDRQTRSGPPARPQSRQADRRQDDRRAEPARGRQETTPPQSEGEQPEYISQHIYGGRAAACFSADMTRGGTHTVRLEAAESSAARQYDWQGKIGIQLSQRELPLVLAVFMQWLTKFEGKGHGENNSKWFTLENQGNKLFLSVSAKGRSPRAIPIMPGDGYAVTTLLIRQMLKNDPFLTPEILLSLVRKEAQLMTGQSTQPQRQAA